MQHRREIISLKDRDLWMQMWAPSTMIDTIPIILLHEGLGCTALWQTFPLQLAQRTQRCVFSFDRAGYGKSSRRPYRYQDDYLQRAAWEELPKVLSALQIKNPVLVGHSDGGSIAMLYASRYTCKAVLNIAGHAFVEEKATAAILRAVQQYRRGQDWRKRLMRYHNDNTDEVFFDWANTWLRPSFSHWDIRDVLTQVDVPVALLQGTEDAYATPWQMQATKAALSRTTTKLYWVERAGHDVRSSNMQETIVRALRWALKT